VAAPEVRKLKRQIRELERVLRKKTLENEILRGAVELVHQKTDLAAALVARGRHSMKAIAATLGMARSNLAQRTEGDTKKRSPYLRLADAELFPQLDQWFNDYNEWHPHKGLRMKSPRQYIRAQIAAVCPV
jgi:Integrase core domain